MKVDNSHLGRNLFCGRPVPGEENDTDIHGFEFFHRDSRAGAYFVLDGEAAEVNEVRWLQRRMFRGMPGLAQVIRPQGREGERGGDCDAFAFDLGHMPRPT